MQEVSGYAQLWKRESGHQGITSGDGDLAKGVGGGDGSVEAYIVHLVDIFGCNKCPYRETISTHKLTYERKRTKGIQNHSGHTLPELALSCNHFLPHTLTKISENNSE